MSAKVTKIEFVKAPGGLTEIINSAAVVGMLRNAGAAIAGRAEGNYNVEIVTEPRGQDAAYGASRPVCKVTAADAATNRKEAENKVLSGAVM